jgi:NAD-dependent SIR2 family protein deacetylase
MPFYCKQTATREAKRTKKKRNSERPDSAPVASKGEARVAICNLQKTDKDDEADLVIHHTCDEVMTALLDRLHQNAKEALPRRATTEHRKEVEEK